MAGPEFIVNAQAKGSNPYLNYSSCGKTVVTPGSTTETTETTETTDITMFKQALKAKISTINEAKISEANLMTLFSVDAQTAQKMVLFGDRDHNGFSAEELVVFLDKADAVDKKRDFQVAAETVQNFKTLGPNSFMKKASAAFSETTNTKGITKKVLDDPQPKPKDTGAETIARNDSDKIAAKTTTAVAAPVNESSSSFTHSTSGGFLGGNTGLLAGAAFLGFLLLGLNNRNC